MKIKTFPSGPRPARIMIVGEAPGEEEENRRLPFVGRSGEELTRMLHEAGIARTDCFLTNVCKYRPPGNKIEFFFEDKGLTRPNEFIKEGLAELEQEIREVKPNVIIAFGNTAIWALQAHRAAKGLVTKWRGSELPLSDRLATRDTPIGHQAVVIPTYHPAAILRNWAWRNVAVHDLRTRVKKYVENSRITPPPYNFIIRPTYEQAIGYCRILLQRLTERPNLHTRLSVDIETRAGHITCIGLAADQLNAICIPLMQRGSEANYWSSEEEYRIIWELQQLLTHPSISVVGQNFLYDAQYFAKHLGFVPRVRDDTMLMQHVCYPSVPKGLDFLSSMYCKFHRYWKDDGKEDNPKWTEEGGWIYNCTDAVATFECAGILDNVLDHYKLRDQYLFQMELWHHTLPMMLRGIDIDLKYRSELTMQLLDAMNEREIWRTAVCGHPLNPRSPKQMKAFFYDDLGLPKQFSKKKDAEGNRSPTLDDKALHALVQKEPLCTEIIRNIAEDRSLGVFNSTFVQARLGPDNRLRSYFNPAGTESFRYSSSKDAFGSGCNFENIPSGHENEIKPEELQQYNLPNVRKLFIPPPGHSTAEIDLAGADAQVVAWEAGDERLKAAFKAGLKIHAVNAKDIFGGMAGPDGRKEPYYKRAKIGVHLTNYGGKPKTLSGSLGISVWEAEKFQRRWFDLHPEIKDWHDRTMSELQERRSVTNKFGYRRLYFDRIEEILPEALAWVPQSTVAITANRALVNCAPAITGYMRQDLTSDYVFEAQLIADRARLQFLGLRVINQVHDSLLVIYPTPREAEILPILRRVTRIVIPYDDPLIIPWGLKTSTKSWGDAEERKWPEEEAWMKTKIVSRGELERMYPRRVV